MLAAMSRNAAVKEAHRIDVVQLASGALARKVVYAVGAYVLVRGQFRQVRVEFLARKAFFYFQAHFSIC